MPGGDYTYHDKETIVIVAFFLCVFFSELSANEININEYTPGKGEKLTIVKYENAPLCYYGMGEEKCVRKWIAY